MEGHVPLRVEKTKQTRGQLHQDIYFVHLSNTSGVQHFMGQQFQTHMVRVASHCL